MENSSVPFRWQAVLIPKQSGVCPKATPRLAERGLRQTKAPWGHAGCYGTHSRKIRRKVGYFIVSDFTTAKISIISKYGKPSK